MKDDNHSFAKRVDRLLIDFLEINVNNGLPNCFSPPKIHTRT